jgi:hypothetical protein
MRRGLRMSPVVAADPGSMKEMMSICFERK